MNDHEIREWLDRHNFYAAQYEVGEIDEPLLVADILANRDLYWGGFKDLQEKLRENPRWEDFMTHIHPLRSAAWLSLAVSYKQDASSEVRENFKSHYPKLVERTDAIVAIHAFGHAGRALDRGDVTTFEEGVEETLANYDPSLHNGVRRRVSEKAWIDLSQTSEVR